MAIPKVHQYKITLHGIQPPIWRRFQVEDAMTFEDFHTAIQLVMGWEMSHLYAFNVNRELITDAESRREMGERGRDAEDTELKKVVKKEGTTFNYTYDFGDSWEHEIVLEKILPLDPDQIYPYCLDGARACPPEDCGGLPGYMNILETLKKPKSKAYKELMEWLDEEFDPEAFDAEAVNEEIALGLEEWDEEWGDEDSDMGLDFPPGFNFSPDMIQQMAQTLMSAMEEMPEMNITGPLWCAQCQQTTQMVKAKVNPKETEMIYRGECGRCGHPMTLELTSSK